MQRSYSDLFEGKFAKSHRYERGFLEQLYYNFSPSTYTEKQLFSYFNELHLSKTAKIIDVGCGGGHEALNNHGIVYGVDISRASLKNAKHYYKEVKLADIAKKIPYDDGYFDVAFCSSVYGHIYIQDKNNFLSEIKRVVKPGGYVLFSIEVKGVNVLTTILKRNATKYKKYWVDYQGHVGLETPDATLMRLKKYFEIIDYKSTSKGILPVDGYLVFTEEAPLLKIFENNILRRLLNILLAPIFFLSLVVQPFRESNSINILARRRS